jgi:SulP family sulfate permease
MFRTLGWTLLNKEQLITSFTVAITQIPEAVTTAFIAGVNPAWALQATWMMNILTSLIGGRPGMISGSTVFIGVSLLELVKNHGAEYVFYAVMFAGILQLLFGLTGMGSFTRFVPVPVVQGFCNAMAVIIIAAQFRYGKVFPDQSYHSMWNRELLGPGFSWKHITDKGSQWNTGSSVAFLGGQAFIALMICMIMPKVSRAIPASFVALFVCTFIEHVLVRTPTDYESSLVSDYTKVSISALSPIWTSIPNLPPLNWDTITKIYLHSFAVFGAGLCESLLTTHVVDELTEVKGNMNRVAISQGFSNLVIPMLGGIGGSGSVGQSIVANYSDGITSLCTFLAGCWLLLITYVAPQIAGIVPLGACAGIMLWASIKLVDWESILQGFAALLPLGWRDRMSLDCKVPRADSIIMVSVMAFAICLDLTIGVCTGLIMAALVFVWDSSTRVIVEREVNATEATSVTYNVQGPLFFATSTGFSDIFPIDEIQYDPEEVVILLEHAEVYDYSGMVALKKVYDRFADLGKVVALSSLTPTSRRLMEKSAYMWQGVNFLEVEEVDQSVGMVTSQSIDVEK